VVSVLALCVVGSQTHTRDMGLKLFRENMSAYKEIEQRTISNILKSIETERYALFPVKVAPEFNASFTEMGKLLIGL